MQFEEEDKHTQCPAAIWYALGFDPLLTGGLVAEENLFQMASFTLQWIFHLFFSLFWCNIIFTDSEINSFIVLHCVTLVFPQQS